MPGIGLPMQVVETVITAGNTLFSNSPPPPLMQDIIGRIAPRPVFIIWTRNGVDTEVLNPVYYDAAGAPKYRAINGTGTVEEITARAFAALGPATVALAEVTGVREQASRGTVSEGAAPGVRRPKAPVRTAQGAVLAEGSAGARCTRGDSECEKRFGSFAHRSSHEQRTAPNRILNTHRVATRLDGENDHPLEVGPRSGEPHIRSVGIR